MKFFLLAMALLVGGASVAQGGILDLSNCANQDIDLLCSVDTYYFSDLAHFEATITQLVIDLQLVANSVTVTIVAITGGVYTTYTPVCTGVTDPANIPTCWNSYPWTSHTNSPWSCFNEGQKYGIFQHRWISGHKRKHVHYCHDVPYSVAGRRKRGGAAEITATQSNEAAMQANHIDYACVTYCPACDPNDHTTFSLNHVYSALVIFSVYFCNSLATLLALIVNLINDVLCIVLGILLVG